jgi:hypothetical protein
VALSVLFLLDNALADLPVGIDHYGINRSVGSVSRLLKQSADFGVKLVVCYSFFHFAFYLISSYFFYYPDCAPICNIQVVYPEEDIPVLQIFSQRYIFILRPA